mgnify:CR=1 FL=1
MAKYYTKAATVEMYSKEMLDLMEAFEKSIVKIACVSLDFCREDKTLWVRGYYYCNGKTNDMFRSYMLGYTHCKWAYNNGLFDE